MGKQQDDAVLPYPLGLARADELVNNALGCVVKVSKLGLPEHQRIRARHSETQLKA